MIPQNDVVNPDDLPHEEDYPELTDSELEAFACLLVEALTLPPPPAREGAVAAG